MAEYNFVRKTLDTLFKVVEVEFKVPLLGFGEIKLPVTEHVKEWWENKKRDDDLKSAIRRAEESFIAAHPDNKLAQILHDFPLYSDEEFQKVISGLLTHLEEDNITWLAEVKLEHEWDKLITKEEIRKAIELYIPFLRHELNGIKEFREIITARMLERIDKTTKRIEQKLDQVLTSKSDDVPVNEPDYWNLKHPYPMPPNFTGRLAERAMLTQWLDGDSENRLFILRALGGFGKSALAWQWLTHDVNPKTWKKVVFWSFYEGDASFENFTRDTLEYLGLEVPQGGRPQVDELLKAMQRDNILLIMDGFERVLRLYSTIYSLPQESEAEEVEGKMLDCKDIYVEWFLRSICSYPFIKGKILITTRHTPRTVKLHRGLISGCLQEEVKELQKEDAFEFFKKQGIKGHRSEIEIACKAYGYHPLSLRILAGLIMDDRVSPNEISVAKKLDITDNIVSNKHHVLEVSFNSLLKEQQTLLSCIACFRAHTTYTEIKFIAGIPLRKRNKTKKDVNKKLDTNLETLEKRGLLQWNRERNLYHLHPIVKRYAYNRLGRDNSINLHTKLFNFKNKIIAPNKKEFFNNTSDFIELFYHAVGAMLLDKAAAFFYNRLGREIFYKLGAYQLHIELLSSLFIDGEDKPPKLSREDAQAWALSSLAGSYALSGQPNRAIPLQDMSNKIDERIGNKKGVLIGLGNMANIRMKIGHIKDAYFDLKKRVVLCDEIPDKYFKFDALMDFGELKAYCGEWDDSDKTLLLSKEYFDTLGVNRTNFVSVVRCNIAQSLLFRRNIKGAIHHAKDALDLALHPNRSDFSGERDIVYASWLLGASYRLNDDLELLRSLEVFSTSFAASQHYLEDALLRCRTINLVEIEAKVLLDLAYLHYHQLMYEESKSLAAEALTITERCGYVLQGADVNLFLAQYALEQEKDNAKAKEYALEAKKLATCDGPPYYYKVAYEEAEAMLEKL